MWTAAATADLSAGQHRQLDVILGMCCEFYNALLEAWKYQWEWHQRHHAFDGVKVADVYDPGRIVGDRGTLYGQFAEFRRNGDGEDGGLLWRDVASQIGRGVIDRFDKSRQSFFDRCKSRKEGKNIKAGYPRFRSQRRYRTLEIPAPTPGAVLPPDESCGRWRVRVKGLGLVKFTPHNEGRLFTELALGGRVAEVRIVRKALRVEVHLVVRTVTPDPTPPDTPTNVIGIDLGLTHRATLNDGTTFDPVYEDRTKLKDHQRALARHDHRHKQTKTDKYTPGRRRKVQAVAKEHARIAEKERHKLHRLVHQIIAACLVHDIDGIAAELLNIRNMLKNGNLSDRIAQQRWGMFLRLLELKAARAGIKFATVNPRNTSLDCSRCKHRKPKRDLPLSVRVYECTACGLTIDRDVNAAINVLMRAFGIDKGGVIRPRSGQDTPRHNAGVPINGRTETLKTPPTQTTTSVSAVSAGPPRTEHTVSEQASLTAGNLPI